MNAKDVFESSKNDFNLLITPFEPSFGFICVGFKYKLTINVQNLISQPQRVQVISNLIDHNFYSILCLYLRFMNDF